MAKTVFDAEYLNLVLPLKLMATVEQAAIAAAQWQGRGDEKQADRAAVNAMRAELDKLPVTGTVVIGEGERDEAPMLYIGEQLGGHNSSSNSSLSKKSSLSVDIAVDPLEGTTICAKNMAGSMAVIAIAPSGQLLHAPDVYMEKIAVGPNLPPNIIDLDDSAEANISRLADAKGVRPGDITVCILDRPRHAKIIAAVRKVGAAIKLIGDGDIAAVIETTNSEKTGVDMYMGIGGAPEGVLAAAALRCTGGQLEGRLVLDSDEKRERAAKMGITDGNKKFNLAQLAGENIFFAAAGVTDGNLLKGVKMLNNTIITDTLIMDSKTKTIRRITGYHKQQCGNSE